MQNVLFKTSEPTAAEGLVEFYAVSISLQDIAGRISVVEEIHGWWDSQTGKLTFDEDFTSEPEAFESFNDAVEKYCAMRLNRARSGFVHSFSWHSFSGAPTNYRLIEIH